MWNARRVNNRTKTWIIENSHLSLTFTSTLAFSPDQRKNGQKNIQQLSISHLPSERRQAHCYPRPQGFPTRYLLLRSHQNRSSDSSEILIKPPSGYFREHSSVCLYSTDRILKASYIFLIHGNFYLQFNRTVLQVYLRIQITLLTIKYNKLTLHWIISLCGDISLGSRARFRSMKNESSLINVLPVLIVTILRIFADLLDFKERTIESWREKEAVMLSFGIQGFWRSVFSCEIP